VAYTGSSEWPLALLPHMDRASPIKYLLTHVIRNLLYGWMRVTEPLLVFNGHPARVFGLLPFVWWLFRNHVEFWHFYIANALNNE